MSRPAIFIDKDGTLLEDVPFNVDPDRARLMPGVADGLAALARSDYRLIIVSNQPGFARGLFTEEKFRDLSTWLRSVFSRHGCRLDGVYVCPHDPGGSVPRYARNCRCRKPAPGLLLEAAAEQEIDRFRSWMIGDILNDVEAGRRAGCRTVFVDNGHETEWRWTPDRRPTVTVARFDEAVRSILAADATEKRHARMA